jgi:hypothetical protein
MRSTTALLTIWFTIGDLTIERHWYHVPRVGDTVELARRDSVVSVRVDRVIWVEEDGIDVRIEASR